MSVSEEVAHRLAVVGCVVKQAWLAEQLRGLSPALAADVSRAAEEVLRAVLYTDIRVCCAGTLPPNAVTMHGVTLPGPYLLQIDELVNVGAVVDERVDNGVHRCLKLAMSDGAQPIYAVEKARLAELSTQSRAGIKIVVRHVLIRHGLMLLSPVSCAVLGGHVSALLALQRGVRETPGVQAQGGVTPSVASFGPPITASACGRVVASALDISGGSAKGGLPMTASALNARNGQPRAEIVVVAEDSVEVVEE